MNLVFYFWIDLLLQKFSLLKTRSCFLNEIPNFLFWSRNGLHLPITGDGKETRDFTFCLDLVQGLIRSGFYEKAIGEKGRKIVEISKRLFRPQDVKYLLGDSTKAKRKLKWKPKKNLNTLIDEMINFELGNFNANN